MELECLFVPNQHVGDQSQRVLVTTPNCWGLVARAEIGPHLSSLSLLWNRIFQQSVATFDPPALFHASAISLLIVQKPKT